jgi:hypothetical protein
MKHLTTPMEATIMMNIGHLSARSENFFCSRNPVKMFRRLAALHLFSSFVQSCSPAEENGENVCQQISRRRIVAKAIKIQFQTCTLEDIALHHRARLVTAGL